MPHKKLRAWQVGMEIVEDVHRITRNYPREELFGLESKNGDRLKAPAKAGKG